jgi:hypothetical protein
MLLRIDLVFSYWIFLWYIFYLYKFTTYSPKFILGLGILENIITFGLMVYFGSKMNTLIWFLFINLFIKVIPFYTLRNETIKWQDINATIILFLVYCVWVYINGESVIEYQNRIIDSLIHNKNATPFMYLISQFKNFISK